MAVRQRSAGMAPPRTYWTGHLRLSLVSIEVALYTATSAAAKTSLRQIHRGSGKPIRYQKTAEGIGEVDADEIVKAFEAQKGSFVVLEPEELDEIKLESKDTIRIVQFVDHDGIDPRYFEKPYYVAPRGSNAAEGFVVIREALRRARKTALGQMATRGRENLVAIRPCGRGLLLETLRYSEEVRSSDSVFDDIPDVEVDSEMLELADDLIAKKSAPFDPSAFHNSYEEALRELIAEKARGKAVVTSDGDEGRKRGQVIDLMEALKKSVQEERQASKPAARGKAAKTEAASSGEKEKAASGKPSSGKAGAGKADRGKTGSGKQTPRRKTG